MRVADPSIEPHHALVEVAPHGAVAILQTSGRTAVRVDGAPTTGWTDVPAGGTVEVGASRFVVGTSTALGAMPMGWVFAPHDTSGVERRRFERDLELAAAAARHHVVARPDADAVDLGVAELDVPIDIRDSCGRPVAVADLDVTAQALVEHACRATVPLWFTVSADATVAVVAADPGAVADSIRAQLPPWRRARVLVVEPDDADQLAGSGRPVLVLAHDRLEVPPPCRSVLEVGDTWRGTWCHDVHDHPDRVVRLHVRGPSRSERSAAAIGQTASTDAGRPFVAEEVASAATQLGGGIVGVPEATRRQ